MKRIIFWVVIAVILAIGITHAEDPCDCARIDVLNDDREYEPRNANVIIADLELVNDCSDQITVYYTNDLDGWTWFGTMDGDLFDWELGDHPTESSGAGSGHSIDIGSIRYHLSSDMELGTYCGAIRFKLWMPYMSDPDAETCYYETVQFCFEVVSDAVKDVFLAESYDVRIFPNPFNNSCIINAPVGASIEIFDVFGKKTNEMNHGSKVWSPTETVASGIYFAKISSGEKIVYKRICYMK